MAIRVELLRQSYQPSVGENDAVESASGVVDGQDGGHQEGEKCAKR